MIVRPGEWAAHAPKDANDAIRQPGGEGWRLVPRMLDEATMVGHERIQVRAPYLGPYLGPYLAPI